MVPVNYLAVVAAAIASMVIGFFWYSKMLFGGAWMKEVGLTEAKIKENSKGNMMYALMMVSSLVMAYVLSHVVAFSLNYFPDYTGLMAGLLSGFWIWLGFIATYAVSMVLFEGRSFKWFGISAGYYLVSLLVMGLIIGLWR
jgi:hypothetical protein